MTKEEIEKELKDLGVVAIFDADSKEALEDAINAIKEINKSDAMIAAPLVVDGETDRKFFNTKEKILKYFEEKSITNTLRQIHILEEAMGMFLATTYTDEQTYLENTIKRYLTYQWVSYRQEKNK
jgi:hypothetical protein